jgi:uncharacterized membrane protein
MEASTEHPSVFHRWVHRLPFPATTTSILLATSLGLLLRLLLLGSKSFWLDESWSLMAAQGGLGDLWSGVADKMNPPGYYLLLMPWVRLGQSESWLRLPSVVFGTVAIPMTYWLGRLLHSETVGGSAAWLLAFSPIHVWYSQEARGYVLLTVLALGSVISLVRALRQVDMRWWLTCVLLTAAALFTHYSAVWILLVQAVLVVSESMRGGSLFRRVSAWVASLVLVGLVLLPWLRTPAAGAFFARVDVGQIYPAQFLAYRTGMSPGLSLLLILGVLFIVGAAILFGLYKLARNPGLRTALRTSRPIRLLSVIVLCGLLAASVVPRAYSIKRFTLVLWPFCLLAVAWILPWGRPTRRILQALLLLSLILSLVNVSLIPKDQWREAVAYIQAHQQVGDVTWLLSDYLRVPYLYYDRAQTRWVGVSPQKSDDELEGLLRSSRRVWLVYQAIDIQIIDPTHRIETWLDDRATPSLGFDGFRVAVRLWTAH